MLFKSNILGACRPRPNKSLDNARNTKTLINDWLAHQRRSVGAVQEDLARRSDEKHLMFDTQDEGGRSGAHPFFGCGGRARTVWCWLLWGLTIKVRTSMMTFSDERTCFYTSYSGGARQDTGMFCYVCWDRSYVKGSVLWYSLIRPFQHFRILLHLFQTSFTK